MCWRWVAMFLSTSSEAARMVIAIWFGVCMFPMCSNSATGMFLMYANTRRVGSRACVASCTYFFGPVVVCVCYSCCVGV